MEDERISAPELVIQVSNLPDGGTDAEGDVNFKDLDIESDDRFDLSGPMHFKLHIQLARQNVIVSGQLSADITAVCDRCAEPAPLTIFTDDVSHTYKNEAGQPVDLTEDIREDILMAFPQSFHCSEDCRGICPACGQNLNFGKCACHNDSGDDEANPWDALSSLNLK